MVALAQSYSFRDSKNNLATMRVFVSSGADSNANYLTGQQLATDLAAVTNAVVESAHGPYTKAPGIVVAGGTGTYEDIEDKMVLVFQTATGVIHRYQIPAPHSANFQADGETVDFTVAVIKQLVADMLDASFAGTPPSVNTTSAVASRNNEVLSVSVGGFRLRRKLHRRFNVFTRNPSLSGQGL